MKKQIFVFALFALLWTSCQQEDAGEIKSASAPTVQFSLGSSGSGSGRTEAVNPVSVKVTVKTAAGDVVANGVELSIIAFANGYVTAPLTLSTTSNSYKLTEFIVLDADHRAIYATPLQGSPQARFVNTPLAMNFTITGNQTSTVSPEVLAVTQETPPSAFGYAQFNFKVVETIDVIFMATELGQAPAPSFDFQLMVEGYDSENSGVSWVYTAPVFGFERIELRKAHHYRIFATKQGYFSWTQQTTFPVDPGHVNIIFERLPQ